MLAILSEEEEEVEATQSGAHDGGGDSAKQNERKSVGRMSQSRKKQKFVDQSYKYRTAMGEYVVPHGGHPLTCNGRFTVGPADYMQPNVDVYKDQSPQWSILTRHVRPYKGFNPAPNQYTLPDGLILRNKFTFGKKLKQSRKAIAGACRVGPTYGVKGHETGKNAPKYSIPRAQRNHVMTGPPSALMNPVDTPGFKTPCAEAFSEDGVLPHSYHAGITSRIPEMSQSAKLPGPSQYRLSNLDPGLQKSFGLMRKRHAPSLTPAPNQYNLGTKIGEGPKYTIRVPLPEKKPGRDGPSPFAYMKEREFDHKEKLTMGYRMVPPRTPDLPAPNTYRAEMKTINDEIPYTTIKSRTRVPYPAAVHSAFAGDLKEQSPGPAAHSVPRLLEDSKDQGATFKRPHRALGTGPRPGPSDYGRLECDPLSTKPRAPAFSMRPASKPPKPGRSPGPSKYRTVPLDPGLAASMKSRRRPQTRQTGPAPNSYIPKKHCTRTGPICNDGISLSSRHSPWVYHGMKQPLE